MKILLLDTNVPYANPTPRVLMRALARQADVVFGGVGYNMDTSSIKTLEQRYGRFDIIIGQTWMFGEPGSGQYGPYVPRDLRDHPAPKVLNLLQVDPYAVPEYIYQSCVRPSDAVLTTVVSPQFGALQLSERAMAESWFDPDLFLVRNPDLVDEKWLMLPHCVDEPEIVPLGSVQKKWDVMVPGIAYSFRQQARKTLMRRDDISMASLDDPLQRLLYWMTSYYSVQKHIDVTPYFNRRFQKLIASSRVAVTCDGSIGYAVRKFFEIPAFGTLLAARFFPGADALGFLDGENCFAVDDKALGRLGEIVDFARGDGFEAKQIARSAQDMIRSFHTAEIRASQLLALLAAVCNGALKQARWTAGQLKILPPEPSQT